MSLDQILEAIQHACQVELLEIEGHSQDQVEMIQTNGQAAAVRIQDEMRSSAISQAYQEETRMMLEAHSQVRKILGEANLIVTEEILARTSEQLAEIRTSPSYPDDLRHLTTEALEELYLCLEEGERIYLHFDQRDKDVIDKVLEGQYPGVVQSCDLNCWGGVISQSGDSSIVVINTLEERFERCKPYLQSQLAAWLESIETVQE